LLIHPRGRGTELDKKGKFPGTKKNGVLAVIGWKGWNLIWANQLLYYFVPMISTEKKKNTYKTKNNKKNKVLIINTM
jgi:hypothetical protein